MKILHLSNTPLSNAPDNLVRCLNHFGHEATLLLNRKANINKTHVGGTLWRELPYGKLESLITSTDVIHFHNYAWNLELFQTHPELLEIARTKSALIQYHSPRHSTENFENSIADKTIKHAVIAQYHTRFYPECEFVVPNVIPTFESKYQPLQAKWEDAFPTVSYSPSNINLKDWDNKGYDIVDPILRRLEREGRINRDVIINVPYEECLLKKRWAWIGIDEVSTGSYHLSTLEYLAMGCLTIVHLDEPTRKAMERIVGFGGMAALPIIDTTPEELYSTLKWVLDQSPDFIRGYGERSRSWMETYWSPAKHVKQFEEIYNSL